MWLKANLSVKGRRKTQSLKKDQTSAIFEYLIIKPALKKVLVEEEIS